MGLATAHLAAGQLDRARDCGREAQDLARQAGYRLLEARAGLALAQIHRARNEPDEALRHARHALALNRDTGHRLGLARTHLCSVTCCTTPAPPTTAKTTGGRHCTCSRTSACPRPTTSGPSSGHDPEVVARAATIGFVIRR